MELRDLNDNWAKWRQFSRGRQVVTVSLDEYDIHKNVIDFKTHREYVEHLFKLKGYKVTRFGHKYADSGEVREWGLVFDRADSDIRTIVIVNGIVGVNIQPLKEGKL